MEKALNVFNLQKLDNTEGIDRLLHSHQLLVNWCRKWSNELTEWSSFFDHYVFNPLFKRKAGNNYGLLKVHKSKQGILDEMPMRVITSIEQAPLQPLGWFIQFHLAPIAKTLLHCIPDVFGLLRFICKFNLIQLNSKNKVKLSNYIQILLDAVNMFPSVDTKKGVEINETYLTHFYQNYPEFVKRYKFPSVECIRDACFMTSSPKHSFFPPPTSSSSPSDIFR